MKVLVTGGTGVVGESTVRELHRRGHVVRVLSRHAGRDQAWWPAGVEGWAGNVAEEKSIRGSANECDVVVHIAGIIDESPPERTFQSVNIDGTRWMVLEAERAGVKKFVYISSLGANRGRSEYHKSKLAAEDVAKTFSRDWVILRPGAVYGPGDEHLSVLLRMVRSLPVIPTIGDGNQKFQPVWHEDLACALAAAVERDDVKCVSLDIAGTDLTSQNDLVARFRALTDRAALQAPLPELFASWGIKALGAIGIPSPFGEDQLAMLGEGNVLDPSQPNALCDVLGVTATPLADGLRRLCDEQPEQLPSAGVGALMRKRYWIDITAARYDADTLFEHIRAHLPELLPPSVVIKPDARGVKRIEEGDTLTLEIPVRGHVQVRVAEAADRQITMLTLAGHPIAGAVRFVVQPRDDGLRFEIQVYDRPASLVDELVARTVGERLQRGTWIRFAENVAKAAGGTASQVATHEEKVSDHELEVVNEWAATLSAQLSRNSTSSGRD